MRIPILDGWRALSILLVLAAHMFPLGPKSLHLNGGVGAAGMAIFFTLSGFLITSFLLRKPDVADFLKRRLFRILPLSWGAMLILWLATGASLETLFANLLFVSNVPPVDFLPGGAHLWSLCIEVQFYATIALIVAVLGKRGLYLLPAMCLAVTAYRVYTGATIDITTLKRVDEILAGGCLALIYHHWPNWKGLSKWLPLILFPILIASGHRWAGYLAYFRPYLAASMVGFSLYAAPALMQRVFTSKPASYVAETSYALYVFHGMLIDTWLGSGGTIEKYLKRPLLLAATFAAAHLSTFYYEKPLQALGKRL